MSLMLLVQGPHFEVHRYKGNLSSDFKMRSPVGPQIIWKLLIFEKVVPLEITKKHLDVFIILFLFLRKDKGKTEGMPEQRILILL